MCHGPQKWAIQAIWAPACAGMTKFFCAGWWVLANAGIKSAMTPV